MLTLQKTHRLPHSLAQWILLGLIIIANPTLATPSEQDLIDAAKGTPKKLNIYNWADYINPEAITDFEAEFGIDVTYDIYDSSEIVDTKLMTGGSGYDVVVHASSFTSRLANLGIFHPVDFDMLPNWNHLDPLLVNAANEKYSNGLQGVPFFWGTTGITYNVDMIKARMPDAPLDSSAIIFDPDIISKFTDCGISFLDDPTSVIPMAMLYLGYPSNSVNLEQLREVEALVKAVRPYVTYFSSTKMLLDLPSEEVCIAMSWSGDYSVATNRAKEVGIDIKLDYIIPKEGGGMWFDNMYILEDAPHRDNAYLFLNYMLRPEVIAATTNYIGYANANKSATPLVNSNLTDDVAVYPDEETLQRLHTTEILAPKEERKRSRTWTKIKTGL
ncbi:MAG: extracellular solute-binding protein [Porticoccaceae bacterium]|nr:extracellular solute-binding protein [Porticoccaceae bacterium]MBT5071006.1 extracellular solute-binding protein [Porticoccaceae bacterium]MBT7946605.1 extracellular solute-binding protein [Porticoccaceae bacterium]MDA7589466.1 extracellular solute-binding protein [Porticoccaceae bacterium]